MPLITWTAVASGDISIGTLDHPVIASWFGGDNDPDDNGETASGVLTKGNPSLMGCALPFPTCAATHGSPLPVMPYLKTYVKVSAYIDLPNLTGAPRKTATITIPVIDVGPSLHENRPIDLTVAAFKALGGDISKGLLPVAFTIVGGAQYIHLGQ